VSQFCDGRKSQPLLLLQLGDGQVALPALPHALWPVSQTASHEQELEQSTSSPPHDELPVHRIRHGPSEQVTLPEHVALLVQRMSQELANEQSTAP
jgi:hypothetical protein